MPEGDTLFRVAYQITRQIRGKRIVAARARPELAHAQKLTGHCLEQAEARGKHLLLDFGGRTSLCLLGRAVSLTLSITRASHMVAAVNQPSASGGYVPVAA